MKKILIVATTLLFSGAISFAQETTKTDTAAKPPLASPRAFVKTETISISYGQPSKKDRVIFGGLVPYGQVWRTGANEATEITLTQKMDFAGKPLAAGTYTLFTIPGEKQWTIILNSQLGQWGAYEYEKHKKKDVLKVTVPAQALDKVQEQLLYEIKKDSLLIQWDKTGVAIPLSVKK